MMIGPTGPRTPIETTNAGPRRCGVRVTTRGAADAVAAVGGAVGAVAAVGGAVGAVAEVVGPGSNARR